MNRGDGILFEIFIFLVKISCFPTDLKVEVESGRLYIKYKKKKADSMCSVLAQNLCW